MPEPLGLDHELYRHRAGSVPPPWSLPAGASLATFVVLYLEDLGDGPIPAASEYDPRMLGMFTRLGHGAIRGQALHDYGNNVGVFRLLDAFDRLDLKVTVAANSVLTRTKPKLLTMILDRGYELAAHGTTAFTMLSSRMSAAQEVDEIETALADLAAFSGARPNGWFSQNYGQSGRTVRLLQAAGVTYLCDWGNDDVPFIVNGDQPLVAVPNQSQWDDVEMMAIRRVPAPDYVDTVTTAFDTLLAEPASQVFGVHLHPWIAAMPHRIGYVEDVLKHVFANSAVNSSATNAATWPTTVGEIATSYLTSEAGRADQQQTSALVR